MNVVPNVDQNEVPGVELNVLLIVELSVVRPVPGVRRLFTFSNDISET